MDSATATLRSAQSKLDQLKAGPTTNDLAAAQAAVDQAKASLLSAEDKYQMAQDGNLQGSGATSNSAAAQAYDAAKANYDSAVQKLNTTRAGATAADLQAAQSSVDSAQATLSSAQAKLDQLKQGSTASDLASAQSAVDSATASLASAQAKLDQLQRGPTDDDLAIAKAAVTQAEMSLALKKQPYTAADIQSAQAGVEVARVALATAKANLDDTTLVAPFSGIVTQKLLSPGALASPATPVVTLVSADTEITLSVEESRLSSLKTGLSTAISVPTYPGETTKGTVASISPSADSRSHTFAMKVVPDDPDHKLKPGMYAEVKVTAEQHNGLLVPRDAVVQRNGKDVVFVIADGKAQLREVLQGLPVNDQVELLKGVSSGEQVVLTGNSGLNDGDSIRIMGGPGGQPTGQPQQQQQQRPAAPGKTQQ